MEINARPHPYLEVNKTRNQTTIWSSLILEFQKVHDAYCAHLVAYTGAAQGPFNLSG